MIMNRTLHGNLFCGGIMSAEVVEDREKSLVSRTWPRHAFGWALLILTVVAGLAIAVFVLERPAALGEGSITVDTASARTVNDGYSDTKFVVNGNVGGVLHVSVRNDSRVPVTILGLDNPPETPTQLAGVSFQPGIVEPGKPRPWASKVTLGRGDEAGVMLTVRMPACLPMSKGTNVIYDWIPVKVRRLGITRSARIPLALPLWVYATKDHPGVVGCHLPSG
jgi:hypothetical protein